MRRQMTLGVLRARLVCLACILTWCVTTLGVVVNAVVSTAPQENEPTYKVDSEVTITGTVTRLFTRTGRRGTPRSRATLKLADGTAMDIHIGPSKYVVDKGMALKVGDAVTVIGSRVVEEGAPLVVVRRITRGKQVLDMRKPDGRRLWPDRYR